MTGRLPARCTAVVALTNQDDRVSILVRHALAYSVAT